MTQNNLNSVEIDQWGNGKIRHEKNPFGITSNLSGYTASKVILENLNCGTVVKNTLLSRDEKFKLLEIASRIELGEGNIYTRYANLKEFILEELKEPV
jgi:hypothetical protein